MGVGSPGARVCCGGGVTALMLRSGQRVRVVGVELRGIGVQLWVCGRSCWCEDSWGGAIKSGSWEVGLCRISLGMTIAADGGGGIGGRTAGCGGGGTVGRVIMVELQE